MLLRDLTSDHVANVARRMAAQGQGTSAIKYALLVVLGGLWGAARADGLVSGRLLADVAIDAAPRSWRPFADGERDRILAHFARRSREQHAFVACVFLAGLRPSEAAALRWRDFDAVRGRLVIRCTASELGASRVLYDRVISVPLRLVDILRDLWGAGTYRIGDRIVRRGWREIPAQWEADVWASTLRALEIEPRRFADARYSYALKCIAAGVSVAHVARYCGMSEALLATALADARAGTGDGLVARQEEVRGIRRRGGRGDPHR